MSTSQHMLVETERGDVEVNEALLADFERVVQGWHALGIQAEIEDVAQAYAELRHFLGPQVDLESNEFLIAWDARVEELGRRRASSS